MKATIGCYEIDTAAQKVALSLSGGTQPLRFDLTGDELNLTSREKSWSFSKAAWGNWYDSEHIDFVPPKMPQ
jgi:hypothetical protein